MGPQPLAPGDRTGSSGVAAALALATVALLACGDFARGEVDPLHEEFVAPRLGGSLDRLLSEYEGYGWSGTVLASYRGLVVLHKGYGHADRARGRPMRVGTLLPIGQVARQFTAAAVLRLQADGKLSIGDPLVRHLPGAPPDLVGSTIADLLRPRKGGPGSQAGRREELLSELVATVSGRSYESFVRERLLIPSGMRSTVFLDGDSLPADSSLAVGYTGRSRLPARLARVPMPRQAIELLGGHLAKVAAGLDSLGAGRAPRGLASTVGDLFSWELALRGGGVLPQAERAALLGLSRDAAPVGWDSEKSRRRTRRLILEGAGPGFEAAYIRCVDEELTLIILANSDLGWCEAIRVSVEEVTFGEDYSFPFAVVAFLLTLILLRGAMRASRSKRRGRREPWWRGWLPG